MGLFDNAVEVVINNKVVQSIKTPRGGTLYEKGNGTFLTIDVPLNLVYSDAFNITGTLKDSNHTGVVGETVKLKVGSTVVDSTTTTTGGAYSFTQTPVATGNHSFQVVYEGSLNYNASESTIVNRVVGKETTVLSVTSPVDNYMTYDNSITFAGTLTDDDGTVLVNKTINIKEGNNTVTYTTTDSNGAFSTGLYSVSTGTHNFSIVYEGDSNYTSSSVSRTVIIREHDYAISISADKPILSYSDGDSCTVTAVLTDNSVFVSGETLSYSVKHDSTVLDSGSAVTDANGSVSFNYSATGVGDVTIEVDFGILLTKTYAIEDCKYWNDGSCVGSLEVGSGVSCTSNGTYITITTSTSSEKDVKLPVTLTNDWLFETTLADTGVTNDMTFKVGTGSQWGAISLSNNSLLISIGNGSNTYNKTVSIGMTLKITYINGVMTVYWNNEELAHKSVSVSGKIGYYTNNGRVQKIKDIKLKPL